MITPGVHDAHSWSATRRPSKVYTSPERLKASARELDSGRLLSLYFCTPNWERVPTILDGHRSDSLAEYGTHIVNYVYYL